jgi:hypothetical protein
MTHPLVSLAAAAALSTAQGAQTFNGTITDDMCAGGGHSQMRMGPTDAECTVACIKGHDARYVLAAGDTIYALSDQRTPERFAAQRVTVRGTLDPKTRTILVDSITTSDEP